MIPEAISSEVHGVPQISAHTRISPNLSKPQQPRDSGLAERIEKWEALAMKAKFSAQQMAALQHISLRHLERLCHAQFGMTPTEWIREYRCRQVVDMIAKGYSNKWIAFELNFGSQSQLCHEFKKSYGLPPRLYFRSIGYVPKI